MSLRLATSAGVQYCVSHRDVKRKLLYDRHQGHFSLGCRTNKCVADQQQVIFQDADTLKLMERNIFLYLETLIWNTAIFKVQSPGQALKLY